MPEGPEIRRAADDLEKALLPNPVLDIFFTFERLQEYEEMFRDAHVKRVDTKGKAMLIRFDNGYTIYSHNQLYGKWYIRKAYDYPKTNRQLRLAIHNENKSALLYSASDIEVMKDEEVDDYPFLIKAGPDVLSENTTVEDLFHRFNEKRFRNRKWTSLLLDQSFIAGIGNYLRSEILFVAGTSPFSKPMECTEEQLYKVAKATIDLQWRSYKNKGITNDLTLANQLKNDGAKHYEYRHWVFNRAGQPCRIDGTEIIKFRVAARRCYYCATCQKIPVSQ